MEKKFFTLFLVVVVGILAGVMIISKQARDPLLQRIMKQQAQMLKSQRRIETALSSQSV